MSAAIDPLARALLHLRDQGRVPLSGLTADAFRSMQSLLEAGTLAERRVGAGKALILMDANGLGAFIDVHFPGGLVWDSGSRDRASAIRQARNSKRAGTRWSLLSMRGRAGTLTIESSSLDLAAATDAFGCFSMMIDETTRGRISGVSRIGIVENIDMFGAALTLDAAPELSFYAAGRIKSSLLRWLMAALPEESTVAHLGDFDLVGLGEFIRVRSVFGNRAHLWLPANLEGLFRYANPELLAKQDKTRLDEYLRDSDPAVRRVAGLIQSSGAGLEQEILLDLPGATSG